jgi:hypothetical protein
VILTRYREVLSNLIDYLLLDTNTLLIVIDYSRYLVDTRVDI